MNFDPTEEQGVVRELTAALVASRNPAGRQWPDTQLWSALAEANLLGTSLPEDVGGSGLGIVDLGFVLTECGRGLARVPLLYSSVAAIAVDRFGSQSQRRTWLPGVVDGSTVLTVGIDFAERGALPTARRDGEGWIVDGVVSFVPWAEQADRILAAADSGNGTLLVLLDAQADGIETTAQSTTNGEPGSTVILGQVTVVPDEVIAGPDPDHVAQQWVWQLLVAGASALLVGVCEGALRLTADYTNEREQFGRVLATFQGVKLHAGQAFIDAEAIRVTTLQALWRLDSRLPAEREVSIAKFWASEGSARVTGVAQRLHGGIGVSLEYPVHRYLLWAKHTELRLGSAQWQLNRLGELLGASS